MPKYNPFKPGSIVHPGMFAGRMEEIRALETALFQTSKGNPSHFLVHGERGIGKSSLLLLINGAATSGKATPLLKTAFSFITVQVDLEPRDEYVDLISKVARELQRELDKNGALKALLQDSWDFLTRWEVLGVKYQRETTPPEAMIEELGEKLISICKSIEAQRSGIYIFIDEADKPDNGAGLGEFAKVLTERATKRGANNLGLGIIGISNVIEKMRASHESSVRIFTPIQLTALKDDDRKTVVRRGLREAAEKNGVNTTITDGALNLICTYSEGYPYFIQQYAYSAFEQDIDNAIDEEDVKTALLKDGGALQQLGQRYFENIYTDEIRSDDYRKVLQVAAAHMPDDVTRQQLIKESGLKQHTVTNALAALKKKGALVPVAGQDGVFRLPSRSFAAWILAFKIAN
jgi:DNA polymerase III delta prime subunit